MRFKNTLVVLASILLLRFLQSRFPRSKKSDRDAWHRREKEEKLLIFMRGLKRAIPYATLHSDDYPPKSVESAQARIAYLRREDAQTLRKMLRAIRVEGRNLGCSKAVILRAQMPVLKIEEDRIAETKLILKWIKSQPSSAEALQTARA